MGITKTSAVIDIQLNSACRSHQGSGRKLKLQRNGLMNFCEVLVKYDMSPPPTIDGWTTLIGQTAKLSSTGAGGKAIRAIDGNTNSRWSGKSCAHTSGKGKVHWFTVTLPEKAIKSVRVYN